MRLIKEIKSREGEIHFKRWRLLKTPWFEVYIHGIYKSDNDLHLHNHPWNIWTIILRGKYIEQYLDENKENKIRLRTVGHSLLTKSEDFHKIRKLCRTPTYTLAIVGKRKDEEWGYITPNGFIDHIAYRKNKRN